MASPAVVAGALLGGDGNEYSYEVRGTISRCIYGSVLDAAFVGADGVSRDCAIKLLNMGRAPTSRARLPGRLSRACESFEEEATTFSRLVVAPHPNLMGELPLPRKPAEPGATWKAFVLPRARCDVLSLLQSNGPMAADTAREAFAGLVSGLAHMHTVLKRVHRDVSAENVLVVDSPELSESGGIRLVHADYGLSVELPPTNPDGTPGMIADGQLAGKPGYMAPEVFAGCAYDPAAADIYSLGVVLFSLLSGSGMYTSPSAADRAFGCVRRGQVRELVVHWGLSARFSAEALDVLCAMVAMVPSDRPSAVELLASPYLADTRAAREWRAEMERSKSLSPIGAAAAALAPEPVSSSSEEEEDDDDNDDQSDHDYSEDAEVDAAAHEPIMSPAAFDATSRDAVMSPDGESDRAHASSSLLELSFDGDAEFDDACADAAAASAVADASGCVGGGGSGGCSSTFTTSPTSAIEGGSDDAVQNAQRAASPYGVAS
mmetsp:Transcript_17600/g.61918  ORF Transcript_17600/g.61918 Transcript_17600/m.61918 type:complete len:490 (-) Transcript_17600:1149-2618(-)